MIAMKYLPLATILFVWCLSGSIAKRSAFDEDLVTYIDYEKYLENAGERFRRQANITGNGTVTPPPYVWPPPYFPESGLGPGPFLENHNHHQFVEPICADPENEVYQECGGKCVLGCRYASTTADITISKKDCDKNDCVAGCFCKTGLIRHQSKCIPATECPIRKCHRDEVYQCGPAAPITCENVFREVEIIEQTKQIDCVWGCYCSKGYLRNSYNGKCVAEGSCRNNKIIDVSPQIPGLFMSRHLFKPQPNVPCFGPQCGCHGPSCGTACYGSTCGSCYGSNCLGTRWGGSYAGGLDGFRNGNGGYPYYNSYPYNPGYYPYPYPGYPGVGLNGTVNGINGINATAGLTLSDEISEDPVSNNHPRPAIDHYHHWEGGVKEASLSGNCIGSNVCNGGGSGVNNKLAGSDPSLNGDSEPDQYEENLDDDSKDVFDNESIDVNDSADPNKETDSQAQANNNENENSDHEKTIINRKPQVNQSPEYTNNNQYPINPFNYNPVAVIGAASLPANVPFNLPNYFNYQTNVKDSFDQVTESRVEASTKKTNIKNKRPNAQIDVVDDPKKQLHDALLQNIHQSNKYYQSFPNAPSYYQQSYGSNPFAPKPYQSGQSPNNYYGPIQLQPNSFGPGQFPSNQFPINNFGSSQFNPNNPNNQSPQFPNVQFYPFNDPYDSSPNFYAQNGPNFPPYYYLGFPPFGFQQNGQSLNSQSQSPAFNNPNVPYFGSSAHRETINAKPFKLLIPVPETENANNKNIKRKPVKAMKRLVNSNNCIGENTCNQNR